MKDLSVLDGMIKNTKECFLTAYNKGYQKGFHDGEDSYLVTTRKEAEEIAYQRGLTDAWECAKKIGNMTMDECGEIFERYRYFNVIAHNLSASEAIAKIKEYDDRQAQAEEKDIQVGSEVKYKSNGELGIVVGICKEWCEVKFYSTWNCANIHRNSLSLTGRFFDEIPKLFEKKEEKTWEQVIFEKQEGITNEYT